MTRYGAARGALVALAAFGMWGAAYYVTEPVPCVTDEACEAGAALYIVDRIEHTEDEPGAGGWVVLEGPEPDERGVYPHYDIPAALLPYAQAGDTLMLDPSWVEAHDGQTAAEPTSILARA